MPPPLPVQAAQAAPPLAPWSPPVQGRPVTLPTFEAPAAPPSQPSPVAAARVIENPVVMPSVHANPFMPPVLAHLAAPVTPIPSVVRTNPYMPAVDPSTLAPAVQLSPVAPPVDASPVAPVVHTAPIAPMVHATPSAPAVMHVSPSERLGYVGPVVESPEDVNPIVRPASDASPVPPRVVAAAAPVVAAAAPVVEAAAPVVEAAPPIVQAAPPVVEAAPLVVQAAPTVVEAALDVSPVPSPVVEPTVVEATVVEPTVVEAASAFEPAHVEPNVEEPNSEAALSGEQMQAGAHDLPVVDPPDSEAASVETRPANAFESAPTELAGTETPIEQPTATLLPIETPVPASAESVIAEAEIQERPPIAQPFPAMAPARSFTSSGSEMPVVITTPPPHRQDSAAPAANLFAIGRELLPRAQAWSQKTLRANPRALVIGAPLVALLGIWAVRSAFSHPKHAPVAAANTELTAQVAAATPAPQAPVAASAASPILVSTSAAPAAAPPAADPAELASAVTHGLPALEALAQKFPNDPQVGVALASQQAQAQRFEAAVETVEHLISIDTKTAQNGKVMGILWRAAQSSASEPSFAALRKLGARGSDIAFDLASTAGVRDSVRERAKVELTSSLPADASDDTRVATALLLAPDCAARKALLSRAEHEGGKRTQAMLEGFSRGTPCTSMTDKSCNSCLTGSPALTHALAELGAGAKK
ncbi:MAG TPA: hypothetical protein VGJ91_13490 [Polyangiaceae bacterium]